MGILPWTNIQQIQPFIFELPLKPGECRQGRPLALIYIPNYYRHLCVAIFIVNQKSK